MPEEGIWIGGCNHVAKLKGFWSYVHRDDYAEGDRISQLARDVVAQFEMLTGETIELFLDKDSIEWGEVWRVKINESLASVAFFIPVMTPRYFMSAECRREFQFFARRATNLGVKELVLPLLYVDTRSLYEESPEDDMIALIRTFQWADWTDLRFTERSSEAYRRAVAGLASRIVEANDRAAEVAAAFVLPSQEPETEAVKEEVSGVLDRLSATEKTIPEWTATVEAVAVQVNLVGEIMTEATAELEKADTRGRGFAGRLAITKHTAERLSAPAQRVWALGNEFASQLHEVDEGIRTIIAQIAAAPAAFKTAPQYIEFFTTIRTLSASTQESLQSARSFIDSMAPLEAMSRDLREPVRRLRQGITLMLEAQEVSAEWVRLIDKISIEPGAASDA
jgi:hypothetical protein